MQARVFLMKGVWEAEKQLYGCLDLQRQSFNQ